MNGHGDVKTLTTANSVWDVLVRECGAREEGRKSFRLWFESDGAGGEYRFQGRLGFGGKFYWERSGFRIGCYPEDLTPDRDTMIKMTNAQLTTIFCTGQTATRSTARTAEVRA